MHDMYNAPTEMNIEVSSDDMLQRRARPGASSLT